MSIQELIFWCIISNYILIFLEVVLQGQTTHTHIKFYSRSSTELLKHNFIYCKSNIRTIIMNSLKEVSSTNSLLLHISWFYLLMFLCICKEEFYMIVFIPMLGYYNSQESSSHRKSPQRIWLWRQKFHRIGGNKNSTLEGCTQGLVHTRTQRWEDCWSRLLLFQESFTARHLRGCRCLPCSSQETVWRGRVIEPHGTEHC